MTPTNTLICFASTYLSRIVCRLKVRNEFCRKYHKLNIQDPVLQEEKSKMVSNFFNTQKSAPSRDKSKKYIINFESKLSIFSKIYGRKKLLFFELLLEFNPRLKSCDLCMKSVRVVVGSLKKSWQCYQLWPFLARIGHFVPFLASIGHFWLELSIFG